jgi:hypothetical protein
MLDAMRVPNKFHVSCPQANRVMKNRDDLSKLWQTVRWKKFRDEHARYPGAVCVHCKRPHGFHKIGTDGKLKYYKSGTGKGQPLRTSLTVNHTNRLKYRTEEDYLTWDEDCEVCCSDCNGKFEEGLRPCPKCSNGGLIRYIPWQQSMCRVCYDKEHPEEAAKRIRASEEKKAAAKALQKKLRDDEKERVRKWKQEHPIPKRNGQSPQSTSLL